MIKKFSLISILLLLLMCSCYKNEDAENNIDIAGRDQKINYEAPEDLYSCDYVISLDLSRPIDGYIGISECYLTKSKVLSYSKILFEEYDKCYDSISVTSDNGKDVEIEIPVDEQKWGAGPVSDSNGFLTFLIGKDESYYIEEHDENGNITDTVKLPFLNYVGYNISPYIAEDIHDNMHLVIESENEYQYNYYVIDKGGNVIYEEILKKALFECFCIFPNGNVGLTVDEVSDSNSIHIIKLKEYDYREEKVIDRFIYDTHVGPLNTYIEKEEDKATYVYRFNCYDDEKMVYATDEGIYLSDYDYRNPMVLYRWAGHGIIPQNIISIQCDNEGKISLIYLENDIFYFMRLSKGVKARNVREAVLAVSKINKRKYSLAIAEFNKTHSDFHVRLEVIEDKDLLKAQILGGNSPAMIDTGLVDFYAMEEVWTPLDTMVEEINDGSLFLLDHGWGKINGKQYGVSSDFYVSTVVANSNNLWTDRDSFIDVIEKENDTSFLIDTFNNSKSSFVINFFSKSTTDSYFFDAQSDEWFDEAKFRKTITLVEEHWPENEITMGEGISEGTVICNALTISHPEEMALYTNVYGDGTSFVGFPGKERSVSFAYSSSMIAIPKNISDSEKEIAMAFLKALISEDVQNVMRRDAGFELSIRKDILEKQVSEIEPNRTIELSGFGDVVLNDNFDKKKTLDNLINVVNEAYFFNNKDYIFQRMVLDELEQYFDKNIDIEKLVQLIKSRCGLYIEERR